MDSPAAAADVDELKAELLEAITKLDSTAAFACQGKVDGAVNPGLDVEGLGLVGLPFSSRDIDALVGKCRQSPFGKGEKTLVDESVRKSWELNPADFRLTNPEWSACVERLLTTIHQALSLTCSRDKIHAEIYKLLIYEEGAFFKPHQDSEKTTGMFGTMVISLPSKHEGGRVILSHNHRSVHFNSSSCSPFGTTFGAWYSDIFHEVEKVTSGHRVVLTYNLVQDSYSLPQRAPDQDSKTRLRRALAAWEDAVADNAESFPPYLVHKLEHQYSQDSLTLGRLKGRDAARVTGLDEVGQESGWAIYLATYEKMITRDDEYGDDEYDRTEDFNNITDLHGGKTSIQPDYDREYYLDEHESDDGDHDESEHEGYTGNEGAPAYYWYRKTVVLLIPPSRVFEMSLDPRYRHVAILHEIEVLAPQAVQDPTAKKRLYRMCDLVLSEGSLNNARQREKCETLIVKLAFEHEWWSIYDRISTTQKLKPAALDALVDYLWTKGASTITKSLNKMLWEESDLTLQHKMLQMIADAFKAKSSSEYPAKLMSQFEEWYESALNKIVSIGHRDSREDGATLGTIAKTCGIDLHDSMMPKLDVARTPTIAAFALAFADDNKNLDDPKQNRHLKTALESLWSDFHFSYCSHTNRRWDRTESISEIELSTLLTLTVNHTNITLTYALQALSDAVLLATETTLRSILLPFTFFIVQHRVPTLIIEDNPLLFDPVSILISRIITTAIRIQDLPPVVPETWSVFTQYLGCSKAHSSRTPCHQCRSVLEFLGDPVRRSITYEGNDALRKHLDRSFVRADSQFTVTIDKTTRPYRWCCTKQHKTFDAAYSLWQEKRNDLKKQLAEIGGADGEGLKMFLGELGSVVLECRPELLPDEAEWTASIVQVEKRKRGAESDGEALPSAKKRATRGPAADDEVIDLT